MQEDTILKKVRNLTLLIGVIFVVLGIALIAKPERMGNLLGFLLGLLCFGLGIYRLVVYFRHQRLVSYLATDLFLGVGLAVLGFICLIFHNQVMTYVTVIFGMFLILGSVVKMQNAINLQKLGYENWWIILILGFVTLGFSVLVILKPRFIADFYLVLVGWFLLYDGATAIFAALYGDHYVKLVRKGLAGPGVVRPSHNPDAPASSPSQAGPEAHAESSAYGQDGTGPVPGADYNMTGVPEPEKKNKAKGFFGKLFGRKKEKESAQEDGTVSHMQDEITRPEEPAPTAEEPYHPLDDDPFSSRPTHDASMEGVSFDAPQSADPVSHTGSDDNPAPAHDEMLHEETAGESASDDAAFYDEQGPVLTPDAPETGSDISDYAPEASHDPLPELIPDPVKPDESMPE